MVMQYNRLSPGKIQNAEKLVKQVRELVGNCINTIRSSTDKRCDDHAVRNVDNPPSQIVWNQREGIPSHFLHSLKCKALNGKIAPCSGSDYHKKNRDHLGENRGNKQTGDAFF